MSADRTIARLAHLARGTGGCFTRERALAEGVTPGRLRGLLERGEVVPVHRGRGVYRFAVAPASWPADLHAALLAAGPEAVVSHRAAGRLWGLLDLDASRSLDLAFRADRAPRVPQAVSAHLTRWLPDDHVARVGEFARVTTVTRTIRDLANDLGHERLIGVIADAWRRGLTDPARLLRCHRELEGTWGARTMRGVLEELDPGCVLAASPLELRVHRLLLGDPRVPPHVLDEVLAHVASAEATVTTRSLL